MFCTLSLLKEAAGAASGGPLSAFTVNGKSKELEKIGAVKKADSRGWELAKRHNFLSASTVPSSNPVRASLSELNWVGERTKV